MHFSISTNKKELYKQGAGENSCLYFYLIEIENRPFGRFFVSA